MTPEKALAEWWHDHYESGDDVCRHANQHKSDCRDAAKEQIDWLAEHGLTVAPVGDAERLAAVIDAARAMLRKWGPHSGSCCTFDANNKTVVTPESCKCQPPERDLRDALDAYDAGRSPFADGGSTEGERG